MLFSFVIPTYNRSQKVVRSIDSVLKQPDWQSYAEILVVDDGSTDNTLEILEDYIVRYQIKLIKHGENKGVAAAKNTGIQHASFEYVVLLDSDDLLCENGLNYLIKKLGEKEIDMYFAGSKLMRNGSLMYNPNFYGFKSYKEMLTQSVGEYLPICRTKILKENLLEDLRGFESITWLKIVKKGHSVFFDDKAIRLYDDIGEDRLSNRFSGFRNAKKMNVGYNNYLTEFRSDLKKLSYRNYLKIRFKALCYSILASSKLV